jgi:signal transduction histidine kinase
MTYVRAFAVVLGAISISLQNVYPSATVRAWAWALIGTLAVGTIIVWGVLGRLEDAASLRRLGVASFLFDAVIACALVWTFAFEQPYVTWAVLFVVPMEAALRYLLRGALAAAAGVAIFFVFQSFHRAALLDQEFDLATYVFVVGISTLVAGITGSMSLGWYKQSKALEEQSLKLVEIDRLKDRFLAITSHELRGPLTAIIGGVDTLRSKGDQLSPEQHEGMLAMVSRQGYQLARLVEDLQITSQLQGGQLTLRTESADLQGTIQEALDAAAPKRGAHQLELFVEPAVCEIDAARVSQLVRNLVENAYKYTPDRTRVTVSARATGDGLAISVADEGAGIPPAKRADLFEAFYRIEETATGREGLGLGLYVVAQLCEAMNGRIDLISSTDGTTFTVEIPCRTSVPTRKPQLDLIRGDEAAG